MKIASKEVAAAYLSAAQTWVFLNGRFGSVKSTAAQVVAEYTANLDGLTLYGVAK